jgi:hypothetical protein
VFVVAVLMSGCGGGDKQAAKKTPVSTAPSVGTNAIGTTTTPVAAKKPAHKKTESAATKKHSAKSSGGGRDTRTSPSGTAKTAKPLKKVPPVVCLEKAKLDGVSSPQPGLWSAKARSEQVLVDGPYKSPQAAASSANSLTGASIAESGGTWVVSATIASKLTKEVHRVALCLGNGIVTAQAPADPNASPATLDGDSN